MRKASGRGFLEARAALRKVIDEELPHAGGVAEELSAEAEHVVLEVARELGFESKENGEPSPKALVKGP